MGRFQRALRSLTGPPSCPVVPEPFFDQLQAGVTGRHMQQPFVCPERDDPPASLQLRGSLGRRFDRPREDDVIEGPDRAAGVALAAKVRLKPDRPASLGRTRAAKGGGWNPDGNLDSG